MIKIINKLSPDELKDKKVLLFTHTDLDGFSCYIVARYYVQNVDLIMCDYSNIEDKIRKIECIEDLSKYDFIILSDLSISLELAKEFKKYCDEDEVTFYILDHHQKAIDIGLEKLNFANICVSNDDGKLTCGTELINNLFKLLGGESNQSLEEYVELVRQYDVWDWKRNNNVLPKDINTLYQSLTISKFYKNFMNKIQTSSKIELDETDKFLIELEEEKNQSYTNQKLENVCYRDILGYSCAIVFAERNVNEIAEALEQNEKVDIAVIIGEGSVSYRTKKEIDVNTFAKHFGGGGHIKASGSVISTSSKNAYLDLIFKE